MRIRQGTPVWYRTRRAAIYAVCAAALIALFAPQLHAADTPDQIPARTTAPR